MNREIKWWANVAGIFPNGASVLRLVTAMVSETHDGWPVTEHCYLSEELVVPIDTTDTSNHTSKKKSLLAITA